MLHFSCGYCTQDKEFASLEHFKFKFSNENLLSPKVFFGNVFADFLIFLRPFVSKMTNFGPDVIYQCSIALCTPQDNVDSLNLEEKEIL